jgi:hypothetical protein
MAAMKKTKFQIYLDNIHSLERSERDRVIARLCKLLDTSEAYLRQIRKGYRRSSRTEKPAGIVYPGAKLLLRVEEATNGEIKPADCRPL